jgi:protein SCO1/2
MNRRNFFRNLGAAAAPGAALALSSTVASADIVRAVGTSKRSIPNVEVTSQDGSKYRFYDDLIKNKTVLINFFYANCAGICPLMTSTLVRIQKALGDRVGRDIFIYSISLKPEQDTPENLDSYAEMHGIKRGSGWLFLRAERPNMELLRERLGFKDSDPVLDVDLNQHTGLLRFGSDVYDRWSAYPLLGKVETITQLVIELDPNAPRRRIY